VADKEHNVGIKVEPGECFPGIIRSGISHVAYSINQSATESRSQLKEVFCDPMKMLFKSMFLESGMLYRNVRWFSVSFS
jgi:hypothetical protein